MILHDTSEVIGALRSSRASSREACISIVTLLETLRGVPEQKREEVKNLLEEAYTVLPLSNAAVLAYCGLYNRLKDAKTPVADSDLLIAATAVSNNIPLLSGDSRFKRLEAYGLKLEKRG